jgi:hypothetical protein
MIPFINFFNEIDVEHDDFISDDDIVTSPVVVPGGTIYNPMSDSRIRFDYKSIFYDEFMFRFMIFRILWYHHSCHYS